MHKFSLFKKDLYEYRTAILAIFIYFLIMQVLFGTVCPFKAFFHIDCPGCGLTRASISFFLFRFDDAFNYNPTFIFWVISIFLFIVDRYFYKFKFKLFPLLFGISSIITLFWYFLFKLPIIIG